MRFWIRYIKQYRGVLFLYMATIFLFVSVGSLYHFENLENLFYASYLTLVIWAGAGFCYGLKYVKKSRQLEELYFNLTCAKDVLAEIECSIGEKGIEDAGSFAEAQWMLLLRVREALYQSNLKWEEKSADYKDYYLMWTHQIKTPISALKLILERNESLGRDSFLMREELFKIEQYVEMVLTFQRLDSMASDLVLEEYDLYSLMKKAVKKYSVLFINKGLCLDLQETPVKILTDEKWFVFCLEQILSNSIKYTGEGGITVYAEEDWESEKVRLYIRDTGIGIHPEDLPRIFEKGFTGYNGRIEHKSTGIGLYLCRQIFTHLGIRMKVESREGEGTTVILIWNQKDSVLQAD